MNFFKQTFIILLFCACGLPLRAQQSTKIVVRAKAKDAKFIGSSMDGAKITILNAKTGDTLATGRTEGGTGDTERLVKQAHARYDTLSTPDAAKFVATLSLDKPTLVTIKAHGPLNNSQAAITASVQHWLIPGKNITGDGIIIEIPGFVINNQLPKADATYRVNQKIPIRSHIVMMCGCPTSDGGLWDSSDYEIKAQIRKGGKLLKEIPLSFTGETSLFKATFEPTAPGQYHILVYAFHPKTGNAGVAKTAIKVEK